MSERRQVYRERLEQALEALREWPATGRGARHGGVDLGMDITIRLEGFILDEMDKQDQRDNWDRAVEELNAEIAGREASE